MCHKKIFFVLSGLLILALPMLSQASGAVAEQSNPCRRVEGLDELLVRKIYDPVRKYYLHRDRNLQELKNDQAVESGSNFVGKTHCLFINISDLAPFHQAFSSETVDVDKLIRFIRQNRFNLGNDDVVNYYRFIASSVQDVQSRSEKYGPAFDTSQYRWQFWRSLTHFLHERAKAPLSQQAMSWAKSLRDHSSLLFWEDRRWSEPYGRFVSKYASADLSYSDSELKASEVFFSSLQEVPLSDLLVFVERVFPVLEELKNLLASSSQPLIVTLEQSDRLYKEVDFNKIIGNPNHFIVFAQVLNKNNFLLNSKSNKVLELAKELLMILDKVARSGYGGTFNSTFLEGQKLLYFLVRGDQDMAMHQIDKLKSKIPAVIEQIEFDSEK